MLADADSLCFRLRPAPPASGGAPVTLQNADETYSLVIDLDGDASTGRPLGPREGDPPGTPTLGVDLDVRFSPTLELPGRDGGTRTVHQGTTVLVPQPDGSVLRSTHAEIGLQFAPTFASPEFEVRISRHLENVAGLSAEVVDGRARTVRSRVLLLSQGPGEPVLGWSDVAETRAPARSEHPTRSGLTLPRKGDGEARIVSYNVLFATPMREPATFARILRALDPDIVLVQEWEKARAEEIAGWFNEHLLKDLPVGSDTRPWRAVRSAGWGVAVVSRDPGMRPFGPESLPRPSSAPGDTGRANDAAVIRYVGALVRTPAGPIAAASVHLKCCGRAGGPEDLTRIAEAGAINEAFAGAAAKLGPARMIRLIAGDFNLVGSRLPLDTMRASLDASGPTGESPDLEIVEPSVLGDSSMASWFDPASEFSAGRLDYALVGGSHGRVARSFILDTRRLSDASLAAAKLQRDDSAGSDHMPLVVDVRRK